MLKPVNLTYGADPELFLKRNGVVIGSERVIPEAGLTNAGGWKPVVVRDGIQVELNPHCGSDAAQLGRYITQACGLLRYPHISNDVSVSYDGLVEVSREELDSLSPSSQVLGCQPSMNVYGAKPIDVDAKAYRKRSAGGHIHIGLSHQYRIMSTYEEERARLVPLFDIFVGNTAVLLDRDPGAAERRQNYGRAGEYRLQNHGIEYRTPSNFWLRNFSLLSLMCGMANLSVAVLAGSLAGEPYEQELVETVDISQFIDAINSNSFDQALKNFGTIQPFIAKHVPREVGFELYAGNLDAFVKFAHGVNAKGLDAFFPEDPIKHWVSGQQRSFSAFLAAL